MKAVQTGMNQVGPAATGSRHRRTLIRGFCATCLASASGVSLLREARAQQIASEAAYRPPTLVRPPPESDEGGLWALLDREEERIRRSHFLVRDAALRKYLQDLVCSLAGPECKDIRVYPVRAAVPNASMAPNGMMFIRTGFLLRVENEAQLAAVIGHELAHYFERHTIARLEAMKSSGVASMVLQVFGIAGVLGSIAVSGTQYAFSREHERDADRIGLQLARQAGFDPGEAPKIWRNLRREMDATPQDLQIRRSGLLSSHPSDETRATELSRLAEAGGGKTGVNELSKILAPHLRMLCEDELARGLPSQSVVLFDWLTASRPNHPELRYWRLEAVRRRNGDGDADRYRTEMTALAAEPEASPLVHRALGYLHRDSGRPRDARASFERYLALSAGASDASLIESYLAELSP